MEQPFLPVSTDRPQMYLVFTAFNNKGRKFLCINTGEDPTLFNICDRYILKLPASFISWDRGFAPNHIIEELGWWFAHPDQFHPVCLNQPVQPVPANPPTEVAKFDAWIVALLSNLEEHYGNIWSMNNGCPT